MTDEIKFTWVCGHGGRMQMTDDPDGDSKVLDLMSLRPCPSCARKGRDPFTVTIDADEPSPPAENT